MAPPTRKGPGSVPGPFVTLYGFMPPVSSGSPAATQSSLPP